MNVNIYYLKIIYDLLKGKKLSYIIIIHEICVNVSHKNQSCMCHLMYDFRL